jgi:hypothetical protein
MDLRKDIYFYADLASFPANGSTGVLYVDKDTGFIYSWNGSTFLAAGTGGLNYLGTWNANTNSPSITSGVGSNGDYYIVGTPGATNIDGISSWDIGDWIIFGGSAWQKIDNSETTGYVTSVSGTAPVVSSGGTTPAISMAAANGSTNGYLTSTDWTTFNGKQNAITLTTTGTSGAATLVGSTLNVPQYAGGLTYFTEAQNTSAPNATVPVDSLTAVSAATTADFALIPKGNGALLVKIPDNAGTGGNKRGQFAVDLQLATDFATRVASGNYSTIIGGQGNTASGTYSLASGGYSVASGNYSVALGASTSSTTYTLAARQ